VVRFPSFLFSSSYFFFRRRRRRRAGVFFFHPTDPPFNGPPLLCRRQTGARSKSTTAGRWLRRRGGRTAGGVAGRGARQKRDEAILGVWILTKSGRHLCPRASVLFPGTEGNGAGHHARFSLSTAARVIVTFKGGVQTG
jgi:hypothetical protein